MKLIRWTGNPYLFISLYLLLIIEGDNFGGFYLLYLLLALPHGLNYAILSVVGIGLLIAGQTIKTPTRYWLTPFGVILMILALVVFFAKGNKNETFQFDVPLIIFVLCGISCVCLIVNYFIDLKKTGLSIER